MSRRHEPSGAVVTRRDLARPLVSIPLSSNEQLLESASTRRAPRLFRRVRSAWSKQPSHSMARAITPEQREDLRSRLADNLAAVRFAGSGESGDDNLQLAAEIEAKAFSAAERQGGDGAADAAVVREYSRAAREMMTRAIDDVDGVSADDDDAIAAAAACARASAVSCTTLPEVVLAGRSFSAFPCHLMAAHACTQRTTFLTHRLHSSEAKLRPSGPQTRPTE